MRQGEQLRETWSSVEIEPIGDFIDLGDRVAVRHVWRALGHGPESMNPEFTAIYTVRKGRILGFDYFNDHAEALAALGISERSG
jgi:hypothetical protein